MSDAPPPLAPRIATVRCVFGCPGAVIDSTNPWAAHEAMEQHYRDTHTDDINRATQETA